MGTTTERVYIFVRDFIATHRYPPSIRDIMIGLELSSTSVASYHLTKLELQGRISITREIARGIRMLDPNE
jgi:SOS-response transcriptional repressor LexA